MTTITLYFGPTVSLDASTDDLGAPLMSRAFALVCPKAWGRADWKEEVSAVLHPADLTAAGVTISDVAAAIEFYTATEATVRAVPIHADPSVKAYVIKADGYRRGPAH